MLDTLKNEETKKLALILENFKKFKRDPFKEDEDACQLFFDLVNAIRDSEHPEVVVNAAIAFGDFYEYLGRIKIQPARSSR